MYIKMYSKIAQKLHKNYCINVFGIYVGTTFILKIQVF